MLINLNNSFWSEDLYLFDKESELLAGKEYHNPESMLSIYLLYIFHHLVPNIFVLKLEHVPANCTQWIRFMVYKQKKHSVTFYSTVSC